MTITRCGVAPPDVLAVIALVGIAGTLSLPAVQKLRAEAAREACADHLRQLGSAVGQYAEAENGRLPHNHTSPPRSSWNTQLLPFIGQEVLARKYSFEDDWTEPDSTNRAVVRTPVSIFVCPAGPNPDRTVLTEMDAPEDKAFRVAATDYVGSAGVYYRNNDPKSLTPGAMHHRTITKRLRVDDIEDGTSQTLFVVEMADKPNRWQAGKLVESRLDKPQRAALNGQWAAPNWNHLRSYSSDGATPFGECAVNCSNGASLYGFHPNGANVLFVDGSVRLLPAGLSQELLVALVSIKGGEVLTPDDY